MLWSEVACRLSMPAGEPMDEGTMNSSRFMKSAEAEAGAALLLWEAWRS